MCLTVAVDFDNCLIERAQHPLKNFKLKPNAKEVINKYNNIGVTFILNTARYGRYLIPAILFIRKEKLPIQIKLSLSKIQADVYIDDNNIFCKEIDWSKIDKELERLLK